MSLKMIEEEFLKDDLNKIDMHMILKEYVQSLTNDNLEYNFDENFRNNIFLKKIESISSKKFRVEYHTNYKKEDEKTNKKSFFVSNIVISDDRKDPTTKNFSISKKANGDIKIMIQEQHEINKYIVFNKEKESLTYSLNLYTNYTKNNMLYTEVFFEYKDQSFSNKMNDAMTPVLYNTNKLPTESTEVNKFINRELEQNKVLSESFFDILYLKYDLQDDNKIELLKLNFSTNIRERNKQLFKSLTKKENNIKVKP